MKKKIFFSLAVFLLVFSAASIVKASGNVTGWIWGGNNGVITPTTNLGWISMNSINCDADGDNISDGIGACPVAGTPISDYGVTIPADAGNVTGYAWSENLGWIDFEPQNNCGVNYSAAFCTNPDGTKIAGVSRNATSGLEGWARIVSIAEASEVGNSGGWEGWISMSGTNYGVDITKMDGTGDNPTYAWSDELGWIDFSRASIVVPKTLKICEGGCNGGVLLPSTITMFEGSSKSLNACYNTTDCSGGGDVTISAAWAETADPNDAISLIDANIKPEVLSTNAVDADRAASFNVIYDTDTVSVAVNVINVPVCGNEIKEGFEECDDGAANDPCPAFCSDLCTINNCPTSSSWREVAP